MALAIPDEDNCITVYASTQTPEITQNVVARCLGVPFHNVRIISRRVGGGFGVKAMKGIHVSPDCLELRFAEHSLFETFSQFSTEVHELTSKIV